MAVNNYIKNRKVVLTFENGGVYEAEETNTDNHILYKCTVTKKESNTAGNPLGTTQPSRLSLQIIDYNENLLITNKKSPFYGYMKDGVKIELYTMTDGEWLPFGVFFSDSWGTSIAYKRGNLTTINANDILTHIGMLEVPKLSAFSSIKAYDVIKLLFEGCGLDSSQYQIDQRLNLDITYFVTKGSLMRDTLRELCQALICVIVSDNTGTIVVKPAFSNDGNSLGVLDTRTLESMIIRKNSQQIYDAVKVSYSSMSVGVSRELTNIPGHTLAVGDDYIDNIEIPENTIGIDCVSFEYSVTSEDVDLLNDVYYQGFQGGLTVQTVASQELVTDVTVRGRTANDSNAYVYDSEHPDGTNSVSTLNVKNIYIQNKQTAQTHANNVLKYLRQLNEKVSIELNTDIDADCGKTFVIDYEDNTSMNGTYYITSVNISSGDSYSCKIEAIKLS